MKTSLFDLFKPGIGPSSSHTMGPMRAARRFVSELSDSGLLAPARAVRVELYGSLAHTGLGHGTDRAILLGLSGEDPATIDPATIEPKLHEIRTSGTLTLFGRQPIDFHETDHLLFIREQMIPPGAVTQHPNGVRFLAFNDAGKELLSRTYFSIGGGFIMADGEESLSRAASPPLPYPFTSAAELLRMTHEAGLA